MDRVKTFWWGNLIDFFKKKAVEQPIFFLVFLLYAPFALALRFYFLDNALLEPHPWRQTQTALTIWHLFHGTATVWDYRSPLHGMLWNNVYEFPIYQCLVAWVMKLGMGLEVASRLVTLISFMFSGIFGTLLVKQFSDSKTASWFSLIYFVNPFGVVFSRVCLIDFFALAATLCSVYGALKLRQGERGILYWIFFFVGGLLASLAKINIWFFISGSVFVIISFEYFKNIKYREKWQWVIVALLGLQICCVLLWNYHRAVHLNSPADTPWLIGEVKQRFEWWRWKKILWTFGVRSLFFDWLFLPFLLGCIVLFRNNKVLFFVIIGVFLGHTLVFFQVQTFHDYYLIACIPYLYALAALGLKQMEESNNLTIKALGALTVALMVYKVSGFRYYYTPLIHDYREELTSVVELKKLTSPEDIIFSTARTGSFEVPLYSERNVGLVETGRLIGQTSKAGDLYLPSVLTFGSAKPEVALLEKFEQLWVDGNKTLKLYRAKSVGRFGFNSEKHVAILNRLEGGSVVRAFQQDWNLCHSETPVVIEVPRGAKEIQVSTENDEKHATFPGNKKFLSLPNQSDFGCSFKLKVFWPDRVLRS